MPKISLNIADLQAEKKALAAEGKLAVVEMKVSQMEAHLKGQAAA